MHFLAKSPDRVSSVFLFILSIYRWNDFFHGGILVDMLFKTNELCNQVFKLCRCFCRRHQEKDIIQIAFLRDDIVIPKIICQYDPGNTKIFILPVFHIDSRSHQLQFHRINKILTLRISLERMPLSSRLKGKVGNIIGHILRVAIFPLAAMNNRRHNRAKIFTMTDDRFSCFNGVDYTFMPKQLSALPFLHLCIHIK